MIIGIHQPNFMPWFGYFKKIQDSDVFVYLDDVKCSKNSYFNRNLFSTSKKLKSTFWLTCPIKKENYKKEIKDVFVDKAFLKKHKKHFTLRYSKTKEQDFLNSIIKIYDKYIEAEETINISNFNIEIIDIICQSLEITTKRIKSSSLKIKNRQNFKKENLVIEIVKHLKGDYYLSGTGAYSYQNEESFKENNILLKYQNNNFNILKVKEDNISIVDLIMCVGLCQVKKMILA